MAWNTTPSQRAYKRLCARIAGFRANPETELGIFKSVDWFINDLFIWFKVDSRPVTEKELRAIHDEWKADKTAGSGHMTRDEELAFRLTKLWSATPETKTAKAPLSTTEKVRSVRQRQSNDLTDSMGEILAPKTPVNPVMGS